MILRTSRLRLEPVEESHVEGLLALHSDPLVMRFLGGPKTDEEVWAWIGEARNQWERFGFGWWAAIAQRTEQFVGVASTQHLETDKAKPIEIGWRLRPAHWGQGFATEAGRAMLRFAFDELQVPEVYAVARPENHASLRVMERLEMHPAGLRLFYGRMCAT
jgi:RimJ/RimL family protein N-acetyltransferase